MRRNAILILAVIPMLSTGCHRSVVDAAGAVPIASPPAYAVPAPIAVPSFAPQMPAAVPASPSFAAQPPSSESVAYLEWLVRFDGDRLAFERDATSRIQTAAAADRSLSDTDTGANAAAGGIVTAVRNGAESYRQILDTFRAHQVPADCRSLADAYASGLNGVYLSLSQSATLGENGRTDQVQQAQMSAQASLPGTANSVNQQIRSVSANHPDTPVSVANYQVSF